MHLDSKIALPQSKNTVYLFVLAAIFVIATRQAWLRLFELWSIADSFYSHGFVILLVSLYLGYRNWVNATPSIKKNNSLWFAALAALLLAWYAFYITNIMLLQQLILPALFLSAIGAVFGQHMAKRLLFPITYLYLALPFWEILSPLFQTMTVAVTTQTIKLIGIPVIFVGNFVLLESGTLKIARSCAGLNYFLSGLTIVSLFSYIHYSTFFRRIQIVTIGASLLIVANWVRVMIIIGIAHYSKMQSSLVEEHELFGWLLFIGFLLPFLYLIPRLLPQDHEPDRLQPSHNKNTQTASVYNLALCCSLMGLLIGSTFNFGKEQPVTAMQFSSLADWHNTEPAQSSQWSPVFFGEAYRAKQSYQHSATGFVGTIELYVYRNQSENSELIQSSNKIISTADWSALKNQPVSGVEDMQLLLIKNKTSQQKTLVIYWFQVGELVTTNRRYAKFFELFARIKGQPSSALIAIHHDCNNNCAFDSIEKLVDLATKTRQSLVPQFSR
jgi:EpsI family protein